MGLRKIANFRTKHEPAVPLRLLSGERERYEAVRAKLQTCTKPPTPYTVPLVGLADVAAAWREAVR